MTDLLSQEVIERLKVASKEPSRGERWAKVSYLDAATILAVLEAAQAYAKVLDARRYMTPRELWESPPEALIEAHDALLALISVEDK